MFSSNVCNKQDHLLNNIRHSLMAIIALLLTSAFVSDDVLAWDVDIVVNGAVKGTNPTSPVEVKLGDDITFIVSGTSDTPEISGLKDLWIARHAGEIFYHVETDIQPGAYRPFLGFDSLQHSTKARSYPSGFTPHHNDWQWFEGEYRLDYTASLRMDANKTSYEPLGDWPWGCHKPEESESCEAWPKTRDVGSGETAKIQRANQKEGNNMELLRSRPGASDEKPYATSMDGDQVMFMNQDGVGGTSNRWGIANGSKDTENPTLQWQIVPEEEGVPLHLMVDAYHENKLDRVKTPDEKYQGYEIENTNHAAGKVVISVDGENRTIQLNVTAPLANDHGFYGTVRGKTWPGRVEDNLSYTLRGLPTDLTLDEYQKYSLELEVEDWLGELHVVKKVPQQSDLAAIQQNGNWTTTFADGIDNKGHYVTVTAYYQRDDSGEADGKVMLGGMAPNRVILQFFNVPALESGGLGDPFFVYYGDSPYDSPTGPGRSDPGFYSRNMYYHSYVFQKNEKIDNKPVTFQARDSDPHTFSHEGTEYYLSPRKIAKRIPDNPNSNGYGGSESIKDNLNFYTGIYDSKVEQWPSHFEAVSSVANKPKTFQFDTSETKDVIVKAKYGGYELSHQVKVVDYKPDQKASIVVRDITQGEADLLGLQATSFNKVVEVTDILSSYKYKDGPRNNTRFARYNGFAANFRWTIGGAPLASNSYVLSAVNARLAVKEDELRAGYMSNWAWHPAPLRVDRPNSVSEAKYGTLSNNNPLTASYGDHYRDYLENFFSTRSENYHPWEAYFQLVTPTNYYGDRIRFAVSSIYDINRMFDQDDGVLSGNPKGWDKKPPRLAQNLIPNYDADGENRQGEFDQWWEDYHFLLDLKFGRKVVATLQYLQDADAVLRVHNVAPDAEVNSTSQMGSLMEQCTINMDCQGEHIQTVSRPIVDSLSLYQHERGFGRYDELAAYVRVTTDDRAQSTVYIRSYCKERLHLAHGLDPEHLDVMVTCVTPDAGLSDNELWGKAGNQQRKGLSADSDAYIHTNVFNRIASGDDDFFLSAVCVKVKLITSNNQNLWSDAVCRKGKNNINDEANENGEFSNPALLSLSSLKVPAEYPGIQAAIDAAMDGDSIEVAPGTYTENINFNGKAITVHSSDPYDPAVVADTVIDGAGSFHVVAFANGEDRDSRLIGFTITGGDASGNWPDNVGGGIYINGSHPTLENLVIEGNSAADGGGIAAINGSDAVIRYSSIKNNTAGFSGGGVWIYEADATLEYSFIQDNLAGTSGGGLVFSGGTGSPSVIDSEIWNNRALDQAGALFTSGTGISPIIENSYIGNNTSGTGGAVQVKGTNDILDNNIVCGGLPNNLDGYEGATSSYGNNKIRNSCGVTPPYATGFEYGNEINAWYARTNHGDDGLLEVTGDYGPRNGNKQLLMAKTQNGDLSYVTNEALLTLDLSGGGDALLSFWWKELGNGDETHPEDGLFLSDDGGQTWTPRVYALTGGSTVSYTHAQLDLVELITTYGLDRSSPQFILKFQQHDNGSAAYDGIAIDDVLVTDGQGPVLHYDFSAGTEATVTDVSGFGYTGLLNGEVIVNPVSLAKGRAMTFDGSSTFINIPPELFSDQIDGNEISIAVLTKHANPGSPGATTLFEAEASGERVINAHVPWGNGPLYWDAGNRIYKAVTEEELSGWVHWVFTKNATTGVMKIYRNGTEWHSGTGKSGTMSTLLDEFAIGYNVGAGGYHYAGDIADFQVFDRALSAAEAQGLFIKTTRGLTNVALGSAVSASAVTGNYVAENAVDGDATTFSSVFISGYGQDPWWQSDLGATYNISSINVHNWSHCCSYRIDNFYVFVSQQEFTGTSIQDLQAEAGFWYQHGPVGTTTPIVVPVRFPGRYVRVMLEGGNRDLQLAELEVMVDTQVLYLPFDESDGAVAHDASGNGRRGQVEGAAWVPGQLGNALQFDGDDDEVVVPYDTGLNPVNFTVSAWVKPDVTTGFYQAVLSSRDNGGKGFILYISPSGDWEFWTGTGGTWHEYVGPAVQAGQWTHLAISFESDGGTGPLYSGTKRLYVDGVEVLSESVSYQPNTRQELLIGAGGNEGNSHQYFFDGIIDDVSIHAFALSADEIAKLKLVNIAPTISVSNPSLSAAMQSVSYGSVAIASISDSEDAASSLTVSATGLPSGMNVSNNGGDVMLSGTPTAVGSYSLQVIVTDGDGLSTASANLNFTVTPFNSAPTISFNNYNLTLPDAFAGQAYGPLQFASVSDAQDTPGSLTLSAEGLPGGMSVSLNASGDVILNGVPETPGIGSPNSGPHYDFTVRVQDTGGMSATSASFSLTAHGGFVLCASRPRVSAETIPYLSSASGVWCPNFGDYWYIIERSPRSACWYSTSYSNTHVPVTLSVYQGDTLLQQTSTPGHSLRGQASYSADNLYVRISANSSVPTGYRVSAYCD